MSVSMEQRRLAAIMFTDMVGYSALMHRDEALALQLHDEHQKLFRAILPKHFGKEVKSTGDGFLIEFASALAAVQCAVDLQRAFAARNEGQPPERQFHIRIGIHLGDVVQKEGDVFGDGVNIAARVEPLAERGGICITQAVYDQVANKVEWALLPLSPSQLKNIKTNIPVYKLVFDGSVSAPSPSPAQVETPRSAAPWRRFARPIAVGTVGLAVIGLMVFLKPSSQPIAPPSPTTKNTPATPGKVPDPIPQKSVAVLPFVNMSSNKENEYLSDGITEEVLNTLARIPDLRVPARTSAFAFKGKNEDIRKIGELLNVGVVLEGSVRQSGNRLRITAQLINVADGFHLWSETFDRNLKDVFAIQEEIARAVVTKLKITLAAKPGQRLVKRPTDNIEAWQLYLKGRFYGFLATEESLNQAIAYFKMAIDKAPDFALAYAGLAIAYDNLRFFGYVSSSISKNLESRAIAKGLELDDTLSEVHTALATMHWSDMDLQMAEHHFKRAIELDRSSHYAHFFYADFLCSQGHIKEAMAEVDIAIHLDPINPENGMMQSWILFQSGERKQALEMVRKLVDAEPTDWWKHEHLGYYLFRNGQTAEGISSMETAARLEKGGTWALARLGRMYGQVGQKADAQTILSKLLELRKKRYIPAHRIALIYEGIGDFKQANAWMSEAIRDREPFLTYLKMFTDDLNQANPYFSEWLKKIGFEK